VPPFGCGKAINITYCERVFLASGKRSPYRDSLRAGRSGDRIPEGGEVFYTFP
jgi:hypothetical protein